jgi:hypothetical protein
MRNMSRRDFLQKSSLTVGAAGVLAGVPMLAGMPAASAAAADKRSKFAAPVERSAARSANGEQIVARVRDQATGEIEIFVGTRRITTTDRRLASQIADAAR